jgi:ankyrin repeat protein
VLERPSLESARASTKHDQAMEKRLINTDTLMRAIAHNDLAFIEEAINHTPTLFFHRDSDQNTILHHVVQHGSSTAIEMIFDHIIASDRLNRLMRQPNNTSETILHIAAEYCDLVSLRLVITKLGSHAIEMARLTNDVGNIPLHYCRCNPNDTELAQIEKLLLSITLDHSIQRVTNAVSLEDVLKKSPDLKNPRLTELLKLGTMAVNLAKQQGHISTTHHTYNQYSPEKKQQLVSEVNRLRASITNLWLDLDDKITPDSQDLIEKIASQAHENGVLNCHELSLLTAFYVMGLTRGTNIPVECIEFEGIDHIFTVIGRRLPNTTKKRIIYTAFGKHEVENNVLTPDQWGDDCVVCDGLTGEVFAASQFYSRRTTFFSYKQMNEETENFYTIMAYPNRKYHRFLVNVGYRPDGSDQTSECSKTPSQLKAEAKEHYVKIAVENLKNEKAAKTKEPPAEKKLNPEQILIRLCVAINNDDTTVIQKAIQDHPNLFLHQDNIGNTLLHYAVMSSHSECALLIINHLIETNRLIDVASMSNTTSDTLLHLAAEFSTSAVVALLKNSLGPMAITLSTIMNARGKTPLQLVADNPHREQKEPMQRLLLPVAPASSYAGDRNLMFANLQTRCGSPAHGITNSMSNLKVYA